MLWLLLALVASIVMLAPPPPVKMLLGCHPDHGASAETIEVRPQHDRPWRAGAAHRRVMGSILLLSQEGTATAHTATAMLPHRIAATVFGGEYSAELSADGKWLTWSDCDAWIFRGPRPVPRAEGAGSERVAWGRIDHLGLTGWVPLDDATVGPASLATTVANPVADAELRTG